MYLAWRFVETPFLFCSSLLIFLVPHFFQFFLVTFSKGVVTVYGSHVLFYVGINAMALTVLGNTFFDVYEE
jgi:hypothetical protein